MTDPANDPEAPAMRGARSPPRRVCREFFALRHKITGQTVQTTDPGRALVTGRWQDIGRFKGPTLRALAPRAPYFHNGSAKDLDEVVRFYNDRFGIGFTDQERDDLVAFLKAL